MVASNLPFGEWGTVFPDGRLAAAIVDRLMYRAHVIETSADSYRLRASRTRKGGPREPDRADPDGYASPHRPCCDFDWNPPHMMGPHEVDIPTRPDGNPAGSTSRGSPHCGRSRSAARWPCSGLPIFSRPPIGSRRSHSQVWFALRLGRECALTSS